MTPVQVPLEGPLVETRFVERPNRFLLRCRIPGETEVQEVHMADPGRLRELLLPGKRVWVRPASGAKRRTRWTAVLVESPDGEGLVSLHTTLPNTLIHRALEARALEELAGWSLEKAEWPHGRSRLDFLLRNEAGQRMAMEVKSVTLVEEGIARFPDAVTARGARHVRELAALSREEGFQAAILFVLQRHDAGAIEAARSIDAVFADALAEAREAGVRVLGRRCRVTLDQVALGEPVPVL